MKVEDEPHELLEDFLDEMPDVQERDEEEYEPEVDETRTHARSSPELSSGTGHRKIATIIAIIAILLGLLISTHQNTQSKPKVIYAKRSVWSRTWLLPWITQSCTPELQVFKGAQV